MNHSESIKFDPGRLSQLQRRVRLGESLHLEFKRKAAYPDKVICEMIAFANTQGGTLLIGVDDDRSIPGVKYPEEEILAITTSLQAHCRPILTYAESIIPISDKRFVVQFDIPASPRRPHYFVAGNDKSCFVRSNDMTVKASREVTEIVQRAKKKKDIRFMFGPQEKQLMEFLEQNGTITLQEFRSLSKLSRFIAAKKLILLVLANVLRVTPTEKGDYYSRV